MLTAFGICGIIGVALVCALLVMMKRNDGGGE